MVGRMLHCISVTCMTEFEVHICSFRGTKGTSEVSEERQVVSKVVSIQGKWKTKSNTLKYRRN